MSEKNLEDNMVEAWEQKGERAADVLVAAQNAPALFLEEYVAHQRAAFLRFVQLYRKWR